MPRFIIRRRGTDEIVNIVRMVTDNPDHLAKVARDLRANLLPEYYLDYPEKPETEN